MHLTEDRILSNTSETSTGVTAGTGKKKTASDRAASDALLALVLSSLDDDKAEDVVTIDLAGKSEMADHMVVCTGRSSRQVSAISEKLSDRIKQEIGYYSKLEGKGQGDWVLVDAGDVIIHVFRPEVREFYQLEKMWQSGVPGSSDPTSLT